MAGALGGTPSGTAANSASSVTVAHTAAGTDRAIHFGIGVSAGSPPTIDSATYGGNAMTAVHAGIISDFARNRTFYIAGDGSIATTAVNAVASFSGTADEIVASVVSVQGIDSATPIGTPATFNTSGSAAPSVTVGSVGADDIVVDFVYAVDDSGEMTTAASGPGAAQTLGTEHLESGGFGYGGSSYQDGADGGVMSWALEPTGNANNYGTTLSAVAFKPVTASGTTVTPTTAALVTAKFAPTVTATNHQTVTPTTKALTTSAFAPVIKLAVIPTTAELALSAFAPTISVSDNKVATPTTAALVLEAFAPTVTADGNATATPTTAQLVLTAFAPTVTAVDDTPAISTSFFRADMSIGQFEIARRRKRKAADLLLLLLG